MTSFSSGISVTRFFPEPFLNPWSRKLFLINQMRQAAQTLAS